MFAVMSGKSSHIPSYTNLQFSQDYCEKCILSPLNLEFFSYDAGLL